jgi:hypothetical protein
MRPEAERPAELEGVDLDTFHYGRWLLDRGFDFRSDYANTPLFLDYMRFQQANIRTYFAELADYTREYAASRGRDVLVSGNFFNLFEHYFALEPFVDVVVTEMRNTLWRQPEWYRYAAGFARGKPLVVVENPYGGVVPELVASLERGRGYDRFRQSLYEAAAMGANMSVPYGAWMGSVLEDAFYPPHELATEIQTFLGEHEDVFGYDPSWAEIAVVYGIESNALARSGVELPADNRVNQLAEGDVLAFDQVSRVLSAASQPYDVLMFPEGELRPDTLQPSDLMTYRTLIVPACDRLTEHQAGLLEAFVGVGGRLIALGPLGHNLGERTRDLLRHEDVVTGAAFGFSLDMLPGGPQIRVVEGSTDMAATIQWVGAGAALHLIRYDYDEASDRVPVLDRLVLDVRVPFDISDVVAISPRDDLVAAAEPGHDGSVRLILRNVPLYGIVRMSAG